MDERKENALAVTIVILLALVIFAVGFISTWLISGKSMSEEQLQECEQIAKTVCLAEHKTGVQIPKKISVKLKESYVEVTMRGYRNSVESMLMGDKIITIRYDNTEDMLKTSFKNGILFILGSILILCAINLTRILKRHA